MRILIADPCPLVWAGIRNSLKELVPAEIVSETATPADLLESLSHCQADLLILDPAMTRTPAALLHSIRRMSPALKILICTARRDSSSVELVSRAGVDGYILKTESTASFRQAVRIVSQGGTWFSQRIVSILSELKSELPPPKLSSRETDVLRLLRRGLSNRDIANGLCLAEQTVCNHIRSIYGKLNLSNRIAAAIWASDHLLAG